ncbi:MAG: RNA polymerase sporulation sigma factor SigH [Candidatus Humimicrobiia bacterium]
MNLNIELSYTPKKIKSYGVFEENQIVERAKEGDERALNYILGKYSNLVRYKARSYFLIGAEYDDLIQEGMIGLFKSIKDFKAGNETSFKSFAELCITRQIITAIKNATRQKHIPLNCYISLNKPFYSNEETSYPLFEILKIKELNDPEQLVISGEEIQSIKEIFEKFLSKLEASVLSLYMKGKTYIEIAHTLNLKVKSVDNALQRIKRKLETHLNGYKSLT